MAETLREIGMAAGPEEDAFQEAFRSASGRFRFGCRARSLNVVLATVPPFESLRQRRGFRLGEVVEFDSPADVERCGARVADEVGGRGHAEEAEGHPVQLRILRATVVTLAHGG